MEIWRGEATETNTRNNKSLRVTNLWSPSTSLQMRTDELEWELGNGSEPCDENRWAWVRVPRLYFHPPCLLPPHFHLVFIFRVYHISTLSLFSGSLGLNNLSVPYHISTHFHLVFIFRVLSTSLFAFSGVSTISSRSLSHFHLVFIFRVLGSQQSRSLFGSPFKQSPITFPMVDNSGVGWEGWSRLVLRGVVLYHSFVPGFVYQRKCWIFVLISKNSFLFLKKKNNF